MPPAVDPKRQAVWQLPDLYPFLCEWVYEIYDQREHPALGHSPREAALGVLVVLAGIPAYVVFRPSAGKQEQRSGMPSKEIPERA